MQFPQYFSAAKPTMMIFATNSEQIGSVYLLYSRPTVHSSGASCLGNVSSEVSSSMIVAL